MEFVALIPYLSDEAKSEEYLRRVGVLATFSSCPFCGDEKIGRFDRTRLRCGNCSRTWSRRHGSVLSGSRMPLSKFLLLVKLFEREVPALPCAREVALNRNTVTHYYKMFREALSRHPSPQLGGECEMDESYFGGRNKGKPGRGSENKIPVFGILERNGKVVVKVVPNVGAETLLKQVVKTVRRGSLIYTDKFSSYSSLVAHGFRHEKIDKSKRFANGKVYVNGIEGFWSYAKNKLYKFRGVSSKAFPHYIKELEVRYNSRDGEVFGIVLEKLAEKTRVTLY